MLNKVVFDGQPLTIEDICLIARQQARIELSQQAEFVTRIDKGALFIDTLLKEEGFVYGVTTGYGRCIEGVGNACVVCCCCGIGY